MGALQTLADYYCDPWVRRRIREYCGDTESKPGTCVYLSPLAPGSDGTDRTLRVPPGALEKLLTAGADVARSMWDRSNLLIHLDLDYQNVDFRDEPYRHPVEMFMRMEPVYRATARLLHRFDLPLLPLITGRGYHFTGRVPLDCDVLDRLASIVPEPPGWLSTLPARRPPWITADISPRQASAYVGLGLTAEFLAHRILRGARRRARIPIVLNGTVVGNGVVGGRACISIDLSYAGDPLDVRHLRVAFGSYQKHTCGMSGKVEPFAAVPREREALADLLCRRRVLSRAARLARQRPATIPIVSAGVHRLIDAYMSSDVARFHREFYAAPAGGPGQFDALIGSRLWRSLPECVVGPLVQPNDRLLQPAVIQHVTRVLMAEGIPPREIAGLIQSRYLADFKWGSRWFWLDAKTRAEFDVRVFAGLIVAGLDRGLDFNCRSAQEKSLCPGTPCGWDLRVHRQRLLERVTP